MRSDTNTQTPLYFTLQEVVERSGLSEHTLRYYERIGLLDKVKRDNSSGHRRYSAEDVQKLEALACLRTIGMPIDNMRTYLALLEEGKAAADQQLALFEAQKKALEQELAQKHKHLRYLEQKVAFWQAVKSGDEARLQEIGEITAGLSKQIITEKKIRS
ncbi:MerR family transcriptional regulator [Ktedonosporobacter rubrisoli]|uniref:MerR family transcriptional regulator n=1 Tax=Ktedonosporobacter rubrisoli TaxID=2509675 RepID=A0A4P6JMZ0_KTERU|nr:MerR family transcriptional regulator [Ktedonosporobacter rubrisoli]QBD76635.1 MerR family transcriptional regulator [Ktedonosporobacter rubrisoli]